MCTNTFWDWIVALLTALFGLFGFTLTGCAPNSTEIERHSMFALNEIVKPAMDKAWKETKTQTATLQGGGQVIEPGYQIDVEGIVGTTYRGSVTVRAIGISAQLTGHTQTASDDGEAPGNAALPD